LLVALGLLCIRAIVPLAEAGDLSSVVELRIPAQTLESALRSLANQADIQIMFSSKDVAGLVAPAITGRMSTRDALRLMLKATTLQFKDEGKDTVVVRRERPAKRTHYNQTGNSIKAVSVETPTLSEVVVTAEKRQERLQDVPISISVLNGQQLDHRSYQGVAEALTTVPGVTAFPFLSGGGTFLAIRGVTASYPVFGGSSPIAYYLDGIPFGFVDTAIAPDAGAFDLARVEVLRGPQGTLYGASALNGVVRVLTEDANLNEYSVKLRASDSNTQSGGNNYSGDMALNVPIVPGQWAARLVLGYENLSGWIDKPAVHESDANYAVLRNTRLKINGKPTDKLSVAISAWNSRQDYGAPSIANDSGYTDHELAQEPISTDYGAYGVKIGYDFSSFYLTSNSSYLNYASRDQEDAGVDYYGFSAGLYERYGAHVASEELNLTSSLSDPWKWSVGTMYRAAANSTFQAIPAFPVTLDWTDTSRSYAVFGEFGRYFWGRQLEWTLGGRYFHDSVDTKEDQWVAPLNGSSYYRESAPFSATTPRAVLTWHPNDTTNVYASYSQGFRSGAPQPYYVTGGVAGFPAVKPDKLNNFEIGTKADLLNGALSLDTAVYYVKWNDVQQQLSVPFDNTFVIAVVNGKSASGPGVDFGVTARPTRGLALTEDFSWNDLTVDSNVISDGQVLFSKGDRLSFSAEYTAQSSAAYTVPIGATGFQATFSASANYASALTDRGIPVDTVIVDSGNSMIITRTSMALLAAAGWEATLYADNLNNWHGAVYRDPLSFNPDTSVRVRPRTIGLQFSYDY
jgi:iron complex outermembrane recepter protein